MLRPKIFWPFSVKIWKVVQSNWIAQLVKKKQLDNFLTEEENLLCGCDGDKCDGDGG